MKNFENYLTEGKDEPYQLIVFANTSEDIRDIGKPIKKWDSDVDLEMYTRQVVAKEAGKKR